MIRRLSFLFSTLMIVALLLAACPAPAAAPAGGGQTASSGEAQPAESAKPLKVINFINGVLGDKSFFDSAERGMVRAKQELKIEYKTIEAGIDQTAWESALKDSLENEEFDLFIVGTFQMNGFLTDLADKYADKKFVIYDAPVDYTKCKCANVYSISYKQNEGSYLAGVYAAAMTTQKVDGMNPDKIIGSVGGQEIPVIVDFMVGYEQGAKSVEPDIQIIRQFADNWNDPAKGKELAKAQYSQGADIVFQIAGGTGQGIFEAAAEDGKYAIGVDSDQATIIKASDPKQAERILTSMMKNVDNSLFRAIQMHIEGNAPYGKIEALGIAEGGVGIARNEFYDKATPSSVKKLVDEAEQKLLKGEIKVDTAFQ